MDIYDNVGNLDYEKARDEVKATSRINDDGTRARRLDEITSAAVVDIAASLNVLATESAIALGDSTHNVTNIYGLDRDDSDADVTEGELDDESRDFFVVGDVVTVIGEDIAPGEVVKLGTDQGEVYADVLFVGGSQERFYVRNLVRLIGESSAAEVAERVIESATYAELVHGDGPPLVGVATAEEASTLVDGIDLADLEEGEPEVNADPDDDFEKVDPSVVAAAAADAKKARAAGSKKKGRK